MSAAKLKLVTDDSVAKPLRPSGKEGAATWRRVMLAYAIDDAGGLELLQAACEATDDAARYGAAIAKDGPVIKARNGVLKDHPLIKHRLASLSLATRTLMRLGLDVEPVKTIGRPTAW